MLEPIAEIVALGLAGWAAYKSRPKRLDLDWSFLFHRALGSTEVRQDPRMTEPKYKPAPTIAWADFEQPIFAVYLQRKCNHLLCFDLHTSLGEEIASLPKIRFHSTPQPEPEWIANHIEKKSDRFLMVSSGEATQRQLEMLHKYPGMRDRMFAFVALNPVVNNEWITAHFNQKEMDAEANHAIPYILLYTTNPTNDNQIINEPPVSSTGWQSIQIINLGTIPTDVGNEKLVRALWVVLSKLL